MRNLILVMLIVGASGAYAAENMKFTFTQNSLELFNKGRNTGIVHVDVFRKLGVTVEHKYEESVLNENVVCYKAIKQSSEDLFQGGLLNFPSQQDSFCRASVDLVPR